MPEMARPITTLLASSAVIGRSCRREAARPKRIHKASTAMTMATTSDRANSFGS